MSTPYSVIYDQALVCFSDFSFLNMEEDVRDDILHKYLNIAQGDFQRVCVFDLSDRDDELCEYAADLTTDEIDVLALGIAYYWMSAQVLSTDLMYNPMSTRDYTFHSTAELLKTMSTAKENLRLAYRKRIIMYSYDHADHSVLGGD